MASTIQDLKRASHIVNVLIQKGFAKIIYDTELSHHLPFHKKISFGKKELPADENISETLSMLAEKGMEIIEIESRKPTLEDYFVKMLGDKK